jgi:hypothetical protein
MAGCGSVEKDWKAWIPLEIAKSSKGEMRIGGIATDEDGMDLQGEKIFVDGLDITYMLQRGAFNWDHGKEPGDILGEIDLAQKQDKRLYVEGFLYPNVKKAVEVFDLMQSLKGSGSKRKLGLSIEGKIKERDVETGKSIKKAWIKNVAVTYNPINQGTWVDMIKSLGNFTFEKCDNDCSNCPSCAKSDSSGESKVQQSEKPADFKETVAAVITEKSLDTEKKDEVKPVTQTITAADTVQALSPEETQKAMAAGHDIPATSGGISGSAVRKESLDGDKKVTTYTYTKENLEDKKKKKKRKETFTKSELTEYLHEEMGYPDNMAGLMSDLIFKAIQIKGYMRTRKGHLERVKPFSKELTHELHRINTMSDSALATRASKVTHPDKMLHFYHAARSAGKSELAAIIKHEGIHKLKMKESDFMSAAGSVSSGLAQAEETRSTTLKMLQEGYIKYDRKPIDFREVRTSFSPRPEEQKLIRELPSAKVSYMPMKNPVTPKQGMYKLEFDGRKYLVDSQGYGYPRYVTEIV